MKHTKYNNQHRLESLRSAEFRIFVLLTVLLLFCGNAYLLAQDIKLSAGIDRNPVGLNEQFTYRLEISGSASGLPDPDLPDFADFRILSGPNVSTSVQIVNGAMSSSKTYSMLLMPRKTGTFVIPAISITHKGKNYHSNAIKLTITQQNSPGSQSTQPGGAPQGNQQSASSNDLFLRAVPSKRSVYVNDLVTMSFKLYFRESVRNLDYIKLPETIGFWVEEYEIPQSNIPITQEVINGVQYNVAEVKKLALFPTKQGKLNITPMQLAVNVVERRRRDPFSSFDDFFNDPLGRTVRKALSSEPVTFDVKPLPPEGKPVDFSGLVGNFNLQVSLDNSNIKANEAVSYKIRLSGSGNLKSLKTLPVEFPASFEVYDPKINDNVNRSGSKLMATRELEYVLIPRSPGRYTIKPFVISFFDPSTQTYKILRSQEYVLNVAEGKDLAGAGDAYLSKSEVRLLGKDINFIKEEKLNLLPLGYKPYRTIWFWLSLILPLVFLGIAYGYRNHQEKMTTNVEYARKRKASKQAEKRLKGASHFLKQNQYAEFYGEISRALIGFVADKTNHPAAGLLRDDVGKLLKDSKVDESSILEYSQCLDEADFRRFAPGQVRDEEANSFYKRAEEILVRLGKYF